MGLMMTLLIDRLHEFSDSPSGVAAFLDECEERGIDIPGIEVVSEHWRTRKVVEFLLWTAKRCRESKLNFCFRGPLPPSLETLVVTIKRGDKIHNTWESYVCIEENNDFARQLVEKAISTQFVRISQFQTEYLGQWEPPRDGPRAYQGW